MYHTAIGSKCGNQERRQCIGRDTPKTTLESTLNPSISKKRQVCKFQPSQEKTSHILPINEAQECLTQGPLPTDEGHRSWDVRRSIPGKGHSLQPACGHQINFRRVRLIWFLQIDFAQQHNQVLQQFCVEWKTIPDLRILSADVKGLTQGQ